MSKDLKPCPCHICGETPNIEQLHVSIWIVKHESTDDHIVRVIGKSREEAIRKWNQRAEYIGNSDELPEWIRDAIIQEIDRFAVLISSPYVRNTHERGLVRGLKWVLSLKREDATK